MMLWHLIALLLAGGGLAWLSESRDRAMPRLISLGVIAVVLFYVLATAANFSGDQLQLVSDPRNASTWLIHYKAEWIPRFGIHFELALDGLSLVLVVLTLVLGGIAVISSWDEIDQRPGFFQANLLWVLAGVLGVFLALDLLLLFLFWEVMLVPMYFLIAIWGHENKAYAAMKFFLFTQISGLLLLTAILVLAASYSQATGQPSFSYFDLLDTPMDRATGFWIMLGFFLAFTVKLPAFPFHTWLPDAHTQAPTAGSVLLAGILLKTGAYGLIRFTLPLFPEQSLAFAPIAMSLGVAGIIYGAVLAFAQTDFKRLVAYSSVSHMGFVLLGVYAWNSLALQGAVMQMLAHGLSTAALFMIAGALQHRLHTRDMRLMGGLWHSMPRMGATAMFFAIASLGLPGMGNFIAEFLVLLGVFKVSPLAAALAALGLITAAIYALIMMQKAFQGAIRDKRPQQNPLRDYGSRDMATMAVMIVGLLWLGVYPQGVFNLTQPVLDGLSLLVGAAGARP